MSAVTYVIGIAAILLGTASIAAAAISAYASAAERRRARDTVARSFEDLGGKLRFDAQQIRAFAYPPTKGPARRPPTRSSERMEMHRHAFIEGVASVSLDAYTEDPELRADVIAALRILELLDPQRHERQQLPRLD